MLGIGLGIGISQIITVYADMPTVYEAWSIILSLFISGFVGAFLELTLRGKQLSKPPSMFYVQSKSIIAFRSGTKKTALVQSRLKYENITTGTR
ncbi:MAG: hypothetical protein GY750_19050 [Lentisphaerae bacterium]|nr:hypothetical protein [Lentisphaerota bacterium]MCP4103496.1 hypothetical protein [Lentisphaerota bacterium]